MFKCYDEEQVYAHKNTVFTLLLRVVNVHPIHVYVDTAWTGVSF